MQVFDCTWFTVVFCHLLQKSLYQHISAVSWCFVCLPSTQLYASLHSCVQPADEGVSCSNVASQEAIVKATLVHLEL